MEQEHNFQEQLLKVLLVLIVDEAVVENAHALVHPQARHCVGTTAVLRLDHQNSLDGFRDVTQVERIV